jgi:hypothetical protein
MLQLLRLLTLPQLLRLLTLPQLLRLQKLRRSLKLLRLLLPQRLLKLQKLRKVQKLRQQGQVAVLTPCGCTSTTWDGAGMCVCGGGGSMLCDALPAACTPG